jgi:hypothetical protein
MCAEARDAGALKEAAIHAERPRDLSRCVLGAPGALRAVAEVRGRFPTAAEVVRGRAARAHAGSR